MRWETRPRKAGVDGCVRGPDPSLFAAAPRTDRYQSAGEQVREHADWHRADYASLRFECEARVLASLNIDTRTTAAAL